MANFGVNFAPGSVRMPLAGPSAAGSPMQQAVKILSLKLPKTPGMAPSPIANPFGTGVTANSRPRMPSMPTAPMGAVGASSNPIAETLMRLAGAPQTNTMSAQFGPGGAPTGGSDLYQNGSPQSAPVSWPDPTKVDPNAPPPIPGYNPHPSGGGMGLQDPSYVPNPKFQDLPRQTPEQRAGGSAPNPGGISPDPIDSVRFEDPNYRPNPKFTIGPGGQSLVPVPTSTAPPGSPGSRPFENVLPQMTPRAPVTLPQPPVDDRGNPIPGGNALPMAPGAALDDQGNPIPGTGQRPMDPQIKALMDALMRAGGPR